MISTQMMDVMKDMIINHESLCSLIYLYIYIYICINHFLGDDGGEQIKFLREVLSESPAGPTPLCKHIHQVVKGR